MNAEQAIARSISHTEIVHLPWDRDTHRDLVIESDDSTEANGTIEIWGTSDGSEWRVHMAAEVHVEPEPHGLTGDALLLARAEYDVYS